MTGRLRRVAGIALVVALVAALASAHAADPIGARDAPHDVRERAGLTHQERVSIDLRRVAITPGGRRTTIEITFAQVLQRRHFDQMFFVVLEPARGSGATWVSGMGTTTKGRGYAYYASDEDFDDVVNCRAFTTVERNPGRIALRVPTRCLPTDAARAEVVSATGIFESDAPISSRDELRIPGTHVLVAS